MNYTINATTTTARDDTTAILPKHGATKTQDLSNSRGDSTNVSRRYESENQEITKVNAKLEKCYTAHPELKVTLENEEKDAASKAKKGMARKV